MFFSEIKDQNPHVHAWARQLRDALVAKKLHKQSTLLKGIKAFSSLAKQRTPEVISKALNWYCEHAGEQYVPLLQTAEQFVKRFGDVIRAMERSPDEEAEAVSPEAQACADMWLSQTSWPIEVRTCLPAIVQRSLENWKAFCGKVIFGPEAKPEVNQPFLDNIRTTHPRFIQDEWMQLIQKEVGYKEHYLGNPMGLAFRPDSKRFLESFWRAWSQEYCGKPKQYDTLLKELLK